MILTILGAANLIFLMVVYKYMYDLVKKLNSDSSGNACRYIKLIDQVDCTVDRLNSYYALYMKENSDMRTELLEFEKKTTDSVQKFFGLLEDLEKLHKKVIEGIEKSHKNHANKCKIIQQEAEKGIKDVGQSYEKESKKVVKWVENIARDFHKIALLMKDGSIKETSILSEEDYLKIRGI